jgi:hypothetical protein
MTMGYRRKPGLDSFTEIARKEAREAAGIPDPEPCRTPTWYGVASIITYTCCDCGCTNAKPSDQIGRECSFCGSKQEKRQDKPRLPRANFAYDYTYGQLEAMWGTKWDS